MGLDSLELIIKIEKEFEIEITNLEAENIITIGDCYELILKKRSSLKNGEKSFEQFKYLISDLTGIKTEEINYNSNIKYDLGFD